MTTDTVPVEFKKKETLAHKLLPLIFLVGVFAFDQITKFLVVKYIPLYTIKFSDSVSQKQANDDVLTELLNNANDILYKE